MEDTTELSADYNMDNLVELTQAEIQAFLEDCPNVGEKYKVFDKIGEGTFSTVYKAHVLNDPTKVVALKRIYLVSSPTRIYNESRFLQLAGGQHNVVRLIEGLRLNDQVVLVLEHFEHTRIQDLLTDVTEHDIRCYMRSLLEALACVHTFNIIHRDVKPSNFLYDRATGRGCLVDFGLAHDGIPAPPKRATVNTPATVVSTPVPSLSNAAPALMSPPPTPLSFPKDQESVSPSSALKDPVRSALLPRPDAILPSAKKLKTVFAPPAVLSKSKPAAAAALASISGIRASPVASVADSKANRMVKMPPKRDARPKMSASRTGTRGFRAPEILMKVVDQTGAVDLWSAGIVLLTLLTGRYPFFLAHDDMYSLYELRLIFGYEAMRALGVKLGRVFTESYETSSHVAVDLNSNGQVNWRAFCERVNPAITGKFPDPVYDLLSQLLTLDPSERATAAEAYRHPFLTPVMSKQEPASFSTPRT